MDTACLRIKFTPLLQETQKSSEKCCLEIVPEVSCIQNLEKLTWRHESNFIEYCIPMTYKIILRKHHIQDKDTISDDIDKTYHSCVDLLLQSSSKSNTNLGSGDVTKIISDTFILNKLSTPISARDKSENIPTVDKKLSRISQCDIPTGNSTLEITEITDEVISEEEINKSKNIDEVISEEEINKGVINSDAGCDILSIDRLFCDKLTSTENVLSIFSSDINSQPQLDNISLQFVSKPKLCLSPICSMNTQDNENLSVTNTASKSITCKIYDSQKEMVPVGCIGNLSEIPNENKISNTDSHVNTLFRKESTTDFTFPRHNRPPPEIRIAQFVHYMQKELLPLKASLDKIISKCSVLGLFDVPRKIIKSNSNNLIFYKSVCMYNNRITTETREKSISNRAVYSIVFDE